MDSRLELRLADTSPRCATCEHYGKHHDAPAQAAADCAMHAITVLNLAVCTDWTERLELEAVKE